MLYIVTYFRYLPSLIACTFNSVGLCNLCVSPHCTNTFETTFKQMGHIVCEMFLHSWRSFGGGEKRALELSMLFKHGMITHSAT